MSDNIDHKVWISAANGSKYDDLSVITLTRDTYYQMFVDGKLSSLSNTIFIVSSDYIDAFGEQMKNLSGPTDLSDATTKWYVDDISTLMSSSISTLCSFVSTE